MNIIWAKAQWLITREYVQLRKETDVLQLHRFASITEKSVLRVWVSVYVLSVPLTCVYKSQMAPLSYIYVSFVYNNSA